MKRLFACAAALLLIGAPTVTAHAAEPCPSGLAEGKRITVLVEGDGPDVVLIPGLSSPRAVWDATAERLKTRYRLHRVQIRGFGDAAGINAAGPLLEPVMQELTDYIDDCITDQGRPAPALVGHSLGGLTAMMIAARAPAQVGKLMVVDSLPFIGLLFGPATTVDMVRPQAAALQTAFAAQDNAEIDDRTAQTMSATDEGRAQVRDWTRTADAKVSAQLFYDGMTTDIRPELTAITAPLTMLYPFDPSVMSAGTVDGLYQGAFAAAKTAKLVRIDGSRHFIMVDQPALFAAAVDNLLTE